ncbi:MAG: TonB-dependent receptor [Ignavibacteriae bacterium]|nr:TonB-dependent receptor [Ignavibacteriota bacterium]
MLRIPGLFLASIPIFVIGVFRSPLDAQVKLPSERKDTTRIATPVRDSAYVTVPDTTKSAAAPDSTAQADTTRMSTPSLVGTLDRTLDSTKFLTMNDLNFLDYRYAGDVLVTLPGVFLRDLQSEGQYSQVNMRGVDWRGIAILMNGRQMNDPMSGVYNLYQIAPEFADRIEVITGPRAFLYGLNSTGASINVVTKNYNSNRASSKLNYTESADNYQYSDGTFSQNISRKINVTLGFQHIGTDGRYAASADDAWNVRVKLRYNLSKDINFILSEYMSRSKTQFNGGIDLARTGLSARAFRPELAVVVNQDASEYINRHDVDFSFVGTLLGDTTNVSTLTFYYSNNLREYRDKEPGTNGVFVSSDHRSSWMGALFTQDFHTEWQRLHIGANIELRQIEWSPNLNRRRNSLGSVWGKQEFLLNDIVTIAGFARYDNALREPALSIGADASINVLPWLQVFGGLSTSKRFPTYQEMFWTDSTVSRPGAITSEKHRTLELGAQLQLGGMNLRASFFHRTIENPILLRPYGSFLFPGVQYTNGGRLITNGVEVNLKGRVWVLYIDGAGTFITQQNESGSILTRYPRFSANGGIYFWQKLINDHLDLKIGFRGRYVSGSQGELFNPEIIAYVANEGTPLGFGSSVDGFLIAGIGNAFVHLVWQNLTNAAYYSTPYYPVYDRQVKLGISWQFLD